MKRLIATSISVAAFAVAGVTIAQTPPAVMSAPINAGTYAVDSSHTLVQFGVAHFGINEFFGTFAGATGTLVLDPKELTSAKLDVTLPVSRVSTTNATLDGELVGADWFDAAKFPDIHFASTSVTRTGAATATIVGDLTMHGVTRPITLDATFNAAAINPMNKAYTLGFKATGVLKRTEFGVSKYAPLVGDDTRLTISAAFELKT